MTRAEMTEKIRTIREEMRTAGPIHYRDLLKCLRRLDAQLKQYDRYQREARKA